MMLTASLTEPPPLLRRSNTKPLTPVFQVDECTAHVLGAIVGEGIEVDVSESALQHTVIWEERHLDGTAGYLHLQSLARTWPFHLNDKGCTRVTTKMIAHISHVFIGHILIVDAEDDVALLQSHFGSWHILVWFADADTLQLEIVAHHLHSTPAYLPVSIFFSSLTFSSG